MHVEIVDDGRGFESEAARPGHYGMAGIREQAELIGAQLSIESGVGRGTRIVLDYPG